MQHIFYAEKDLLASFDIYMVNEETYSWQQLKT